MRSKVTTFLFLCFLAFFSMGYLLVKDRDFSEMENRNLAKLPKPMGKTIFSGEYEEDMEKYLSDQIVFKDLLMSLKVDSDRWMNQTKVNGVYFGKNDTLIQEYTQPGQQFYSNLDEINSFAVRHDLPIYFLAVPNSCEINQDLLPAFASCYSQDAVMRAIEAALQNVTLVNGIPPLKARSNENIYFKTDHHWTMRGAYYGYRAMMQAMGLPYQSLTDYSYHLASSQYLGSLYSKAPSRTISPENLDLYQNDDGQYQVTYKDENRTTDTLFELSHLDKKDKYQVFLDGNHAELTIESNADNQENLLVLKDSYAHAMLPFLADSFQHIFVLDLRYYHHSIDDYIQENKIDRVLFLYNIDFFSTDSNFVWLN